MMTIANMVAERSYRSAEEEPQAEFDTLTKLMKEMSQGKIKGRYVMRIPLDPIPKIMMIAVAEEFGKPLVVKNVPVPDSGYGQVPVNVIISGVRHTDFHPRDGDWLVKPSSRSSQATRVSAWW